MTVSPTDIITKALDALSIRYGFTAQNIANANTPDYRPVHVSFEDQLRDAATRGDDAVAQFHPETISDASDARPMRLDLELASASQTAMRYRALVEVLARQFALSRTLIEGGR